MRIIRILFFPVRLVWGLLVISVFTVMYGMGFDIDLENGFKETVTYIVKG